MKRYKKYAAWIYLLNLALLTTHEIDSAYWHEWNLFGLPGGIGLFLILNFALLAVFIYGYESTAVWGSGAAVYSSLLAFSGIFAFTIHTSFIVAGHPEFTTAISLSILALTLIVSIIQLLLVILIRWQQSA